MKIIVFSFLLLSSIFANKVFDISENDYSLYLKDNNKMIEVFKNRFIFKKQNKAKPEIMTVKKKEIIIVDSSKKVKAKAKKIIAKKHIVKIIKNEFYSKNELLTKLDVSNIQKEKNIKKLTNSIGNILENKNTKYNIVDIEEIIKMINYNKLSKFESEIYLKQIKQFIKGN